MKWTLHPLKALSELGRVWDEINASNANLPILDSLFFARLAAMSETREGKLALCEDAGVPVAATMLVNNHFGAWQTYQPSQAPLGAWVQKGALPLAKLLETLGQALPASTLLVSASQLDPDVNPRPDSDKRLRTLDYIDTARLTLNESFEDYWSLRGKNLKKNVKRQRNRLEREGIATRFECIRDSSSIGAAVDDYGLIESRGWKAKEGTALHPKNVQGRFYRALFEDMSERGEAFALRYSYNDALVATDLYLERDGVLILLKTTYDETQTTTSPSSLLREESLQLFFRSGHYRRVEFYGRVMDWHKKWTTEFRRLYHANFYCSTITATLLAIKHKLSL